MGMDPRTGDAYDLRSPEDIGRALKAMEHDNQEIRGIDLSEIERLQSMSRQQRRAELRKRPAVEKAELERLLKEARESAG
jgi:hypothetical protein